MSEYVCRIANVDKIACRFLYVMMIELMSNTKKHAYDVYETILDPHWYCFAEFDKDDTIAFTFMDTGEGIPSTVQKNFPEKIDLLGIKSDDKYVISALDGDFRTATKESFRGKGLPKLRSFCSEGKIHNMRIVTNKANVTVEKNSFSSTNIVPAFQTLCRQENMYPVSPLSEYLLPVFPDTADHHKRFCGPFQDHSDFEASRKVLYGLRGVVRRFR